MLLGATLSIWAASQQQRRFDAAQVAEFQSVAERSHDALVLQLDACGWLVRSVQTLFLSSEQVTQSEFDSVYAN
ncbi:MAG: hypothetical protein ACREPE_10180, partial [Lysobacter sp.]